MPEYIIHACHQRMWYVDKYLIPSMLRQGIERDRISLHLDVERAGNLVSCMTSFLRCSGSGGAWHLQDDVVICHDFAERTADLDDGIVCGYCFGEFGPDIAVSGKVPAAFMWNSFPCIRIPHNLAHECAVWFWDEARHLPQYAQWVESGKHDDGFWHDFIRIRHPDLMVLNIRPSLVDHVDYLIGGTQINHDRIDKITRSTYFEDHYLVDGLKEQLEAVQ